MLFDLVFLVAKYLFFLSLLPVAYLLYKLVYVFIRYQILKRPFHQQRAKIHHLDRMSILPAFELFIPSGMQRLLDSCFKDDGSLKKILYGGSYYDGIPFVIITDPDDLREVLTREDLFEKLPLSYDVLKLLIGDGLVTSKGKKWQLHRKLITPLFHFKALRSMDQKMNNESLRFLQELQQKNGERLVPFQEFSCVTIRIVISCIFGGEMNADALYDQWNSLIHDMPGFFSSCLTLGLPMAKFLRIPPVLRTMKRLHRIRTDIQNAAARVRQKLEDGSINYNESSSLITSMIAAKDEDGSFMSDYDIVEEVMTFMFAGYDTTSNTLSWSVYYLGRRPDVVQKIREELHQHFPDGEIDPSKTRDLVYLENVIKEVLRLRTPGALLVKRSMFDCEFQGVKIPAGTYFGALNIATQHDKDHWENPFDFDPDRFLKPRSHAYSYIPFSAGPRNCVGRKFSLLETSIILAQLVQKFDIVVDPDEKVQMFFKTTVTPHGLHARFVPREQQQQQQQ